MVGAAFACAVGKQGLKVAVVESRNAEEELNPEGIDVRVSALTCASERILKALEVWDYLSGQRITPFREMTVWDATGAGAIHFDSADIGAPTLGYIVENRTIQQAMERGLSKLDSVTWFRPATLEDCRIEEDTVIVRVGSVRLRTGLVVGADGTDSKLRELLHIGSSTGDYGQQALVATVRTERHHRNTAWQRFLPEGPLAFLPLPEDLSSIVWTTTPERARYLMRAPEGQFLDELERAFAATLGRVTWVGERATFPLRCAQADHYVQHRAALIGDAAHTIHPLAGQGVNLGFLDAAALAEVIRGAHSRGRDFGHRTVLRRYERWRKGHNVLTQMTLDGFKWLFGSSCLVVGAARNMGLDVTDRLGPVKKRIMRHASGLSGDLPPMARTQPPFRV